MRAVLYCSCVGLLVLGLALTSCAQAPVNPDMSVAVDTRFFVHNDRQSRPQEAGKPQFDFREFELDVNGYLNPYARADVALSIDGVKGEVEAEEAFMTLLRGLPWNLQLRAGRFRPDFGKINTQHPHVWPWVTRPLMATEIFGDDGLKDVGLNLGSMIPVGSSALGISASVLQTGGLVAPPVDSLATFYDESSPRSPAALGRISIFSPLGDYTSLEMGLSYMRTEFQSDQHRYANLGSFDFKLKWRPNSYQSLVLVAEAFLDNRDIPIQNDSLGNALAEKTVNSVGAFTSLDYWFRKRFDVGALYDFTQRSFDSSQNLFGYGVFAGFNVAEETTHFGLLLRRDQGTGIDGYNTAMLQILFALGPHKPHPF